MKSLEERLQEVMNIRIQIKNLGIEAHHKDDLRPLFDIMNAFVKEGISASGKVDIPAMEFSKLEYQFTTKDTHESFCRVIK